MRVETSSGDETKNLAKRLARNLQGGELLLLIGELGSGKTTFVQGLAGGLESTVAVSSPTFVLERRYPGRLELVHLDFYRLKEVGEAEALGLELGDSGQVVAVEWADRFPELFEGRDRLEITFQNEGDEHSLEFLPYGDHLKSVISSLSRNLSERSLDSARDDTEGLG